jgi:hypothetical protein
MSLPLHTLYYLVACRRETLVTYLCGTPLLKNRFQLSSVVTSSLQQATRAPPARLLYGNLVGPLQLHRFPYFIRCRNLEGKFFKYRADLSHLLGTRLGQFTFGEIETVF